MELLNEEGGMFDSPLMDAYVSSSTAPVSHSPELHNERDHFITPSAAVFKPLECITCCWFFFLFFLGRSNNERHGGNALLRRS